MRDEASEPLKPPCAIPWTCPVFPLIKSLSHLPIIVDPSHATGIASLVKPMSMAAVAAGADGLMIEVHNDPVHALCDGAQSLTPAAFQDVMNAVMQILPLAYKGETK
jgi:3-deoxy-7-phosphoheptulonate synthase